MSTSKKKQELAEFVGLRTGYSYDPNRLVVTWARRFAAYKRVDALFSDINRLHSIVSQPGKEVQLLIAGRAHANDTLAKDTLQRIIQYMQHDLAGYALFIPNYDINAAQMLVKGSDVWLNTPVTGQEASGTSGMKAAANGVLQCTVEDGWTAEVDWNDVGWTLDSDNLAETLYFRLEEDIVPKFYRRNQDNIPETWLERMKRTLLVSENFSTRRMLREYQTKLYDCEIG